MFDREEPYKIFISYEREDAHVWAGLVYERLRSYYRDGVVFKDLEETRTGTDWAPRLARLLKKCEAVVLVIGQDWKEARVLEKLNDPTNWVHKEIVSAIDEGKKIFPVVAEGAQLPDQTKVPAKIYQAIARQQFRLRKSSLFWDSDIERLCADIDAETGLGSDRRQATATNPMAVFEHVICRLDRTLEWGSLLQGYSGGHRFFLANGSKKSGFRYFATRCSLEVTNPNFTSRPTEVMTRTETARIGALSWSRYADPADPQMRRTLLLKEIASTLFADSPPRDDSRIEVWVRERIQKNQRPTVVYSTAMRGSPDEKTRIDEWFSIWRELLGETRSSTVAVILFLESGWWPWRGSGLRSQDRERHVLSPALGKVPRRYFDEWLDTDVQRLAYDDLKPKLRQTGDRLYSMFRPARHFDDISEEVHKIWRDHGSH